MSELEPTIYFQLIGMSPSEPHISGTAMCIHVHGMLACLLTTYHNFKFVHSNMSVKDCMYTCMYFGSVQSGQHQSVTFSVKETGCKEDSS